MQPLAMGSSTTALQAKYNEIRELFAMKLGARGFALLGVAVLFLCLFTHMLYICCVLQPEVGSSK